MCGGGGDRHQRGREEGGMVRLIGKGILSIVEEGIVHVKGGLSGESECLPGCQIKRL